jgi:hypothetical protein
MKNEAKERITDNEGWEVEGMDFDNETTSEEKVKASSFSYNKKKFQLDNSSKKK